MKVSTGSNTPPTLTNQISGFTVNEGFSKEIVLTPCDDPDVGDLASIVVTFADSNNPSVPLNATVSGSCTTTLIFKFTANMGINTDLIQINLTLTDSMLDFTTYTFNATINRAPQFDTSLDSQAFCYVNKTLSKLLPTYSDPD